MHKTSRECAKYARRNARFYHNCPHFLLNAMTTPPGKRPANTPFDRNLIMCPITRDIMTDPVVASDGHTYERGAIKRWLEENDTSPMTNEFLDSHYVYPNHAVRSIIAAMKPRQADCPQPPERDQEVPSMPDLDHEGMHQALKASMRDYWEKKGLLADGTASPEDEVVITGIVSKLEVGGELLPPISVGDSVMDVD